MKIGDVEIKFLGHSGFLLSNGKKIVIDPYNLAGNIDKADMVLITHSHYDHCSIKDIEKIVKKGTIILCTADCQSKIVKIEGVEMHVVEVGDKADFGSIKVEAVAAYNKNKEFHPKSEGWVGYVIKMNNVIIYHSGDTDFIPEMQRLSGYGKKDNEFVALLPVSGKYVMDAEAAAEAASLISPDFAIPMHYGAGVIGSREDAEHFVELCKEKGLNAEILEKI
ncbi:Zn-dependent hydrolase [Candidatus Pacearchaeota archaeon CG10_big_fil_rev_8_21_14_0_10_34_76]|nr:MAG: Zn-dependent hydrolase [Candidatus Pacearchaeota archaeon CG10_big_fil_rev_8_21_14_0_10_34_76]